MPLDTHKTNQPTGFRRLTLTMLAARDRADAFAGAPRGSAKPLTYLAAFQEAEPYLGLPSHAFKLICWLVKQTMACDWEEGSRPIAWPSARRQQEFLCLSAPRVKALNRALYEAGIFVIRDNEQGKRYGRRNTEGRIIEAYGFDLSPLATRYAEFVRIAAEARGERERMRTLRKRVTIARRAIRQTGEMLAEVGPLPAEWPRLEAETADLVVAAHQALRSEELALAATALERRQVEAEQWLKATSKPVNTDPMGFENEPHTTSTNLAINPIDTVIASERSSRAEGGSSQPQSSSLPHPSQKIPENNLRLDPAQLLDLAPRLAQYARSGRASWPDVVNAAGALRTELGISTSLWGEACGVMGREAAALAIAIVSTKSEQHFTRSAGGYFAGMVRKFEAGDLHLDRSVWALREAKWGNADRKRVN